MAGPCPPAPAACLMAFMHLAWGIDLSAQEIIQLPAEDHWLDADFEEVYRVGSVAGEDWEQFAKIVSLGFDGAGNLHVLDGQASRVVVVAPDGSRLREYGRAGDGPGEFRAANQIAVMADGHAMVFDREHSAFHIFDPGGQVVRTVRMPGGALMTNMPDLDLAGTGDRVIPNGSVSSVSFNLLAGIETDEPGRHSRPVTRLSLSGDEVETDTIAEAWMAPPVQTAQRQASNGVVWLGSEALALAPSLFVGAIPGGGVAFSDSSAYAIKVAGSEGAILRILTRPFRPQPVTDRVREAEKERRLRLEEESASEAFKSAAGVSERIGAMLDRILESRRELVETMHFYEEVSVVRGLQTGWGGTIWVQRGGDDPLSDGPIDMLTAAGRYLGSYPAGASVIPSAFGPNGLAAFIERDEFDVEMVVVRRLPLAVK